MATTHTRRPGHRAGVVTTCLWLSCAGVAAQPPSLDPVVLVRVPDAGLQPAAEVDDAGRVHLIYFRGDPSGGDVFYVSRPPTSGFSAPVRVNSQPGSVIATGTVRGAHLSLGADGRPHVAWMGSNTAEPRGPDGQSPMLYTRLGDDGRFEPQRNLVTHAYGLDGGGTIAAGPPGHVAVLWHADAGRGGEDQRQVWMTTSSDGGLTFAPERPVSEPGVCGCCGLSADFDPAGTVRALYRGFDAPDHRSMYLLSAGDGDFERVELEPWRIGACPMSTSSMTTDDDALLVAWETAGQVSWARMPAQGSISPRVVRPTVEGTHRKHPAVAASPDGHVLMAWAEGAGWNRGGALRWELFDPDGRSTGVSGARPGVPAWSHPAVVASAGQFIILY
jgi:hypothetical protein